MDNDKCFYTVKEFAKLLSISDQGIRKLIKTDQIKSLRFSDSKKGKIRIPKSELLRLQAEAYGNKENESE